MQVRLQPLLVIHPEDTLHTAVDEPPVEEEDERKQDIQESIQQIDDPLLNLTAVLPGCGGFRSFRQTDLCEGHLQDVACHLLWLVDLDEVAPLRQSSELGKSL